MKISLLVLSFLLTPLSSFASANVACHDQMTTDVVLFINNSKIVQVRVQRQGSLPNVFSAQEVRELGDSMLYSVSGAAGLMEVKKSVLENQGGWLKFNGQNFDCDSN